MLHRIIQFSVENKLVILILVFFLIGFGIYQLQHLPIDAVPDITDNQVQVITSAPSLGATDIERLITFPIEQANSNISCIKEIRSFSRFGLSLVTIVFDDEIDVYWARQQVSERLSKVRSEIPVGTGIPELGPVTTGLGEIYQYVVRPERGYEHKYDVTKLRTIQDWIIRRQLLGVEGIADVSSFGGKLMQYEIAVDPDRLNSYGITIDDVFKALETNNQNTGGAYIEKGPSVLFIRTEGLLKSLEDIGSITIKGSMHHTPILIRDVAKVGIGHAIRYGAMCYNDQGEVSGAVVMMLKGANSSDVIARVKDRVREIQKTLPKGVVIEPFLDRTKMVNHAITTISYNLFEGALIVIFVLVLFLGNIRAGFIVSSVIPLSLLFAICMMNFFGVSGNLMSLGALDFGLIIDGAVIIVEAVMHNLTHNFQSNQTLRNQKETNLEVVNTSTKMMNSAVFGQLIILIVYLPILTLQGVEGKMFKPMAQTVAFALLGAFILSITYIPMMTSLIITKKPYELSFSKKMMKKIISWFDYLFPKIYAHPKRIIRSILALFIISIIILSKLGGEFIPALEEGDFALETRVLAGSNLNVSIQASHDASKVLLNNFPEIEKIVSKIGSGEIPTDPMPIEAQDLMIILKDKDEWVSAKSFDELAKKMENKLADIPGVTFGFQYPVQMRFNELMTGARQDIVCKIFGENLDTLSKYATILGNLASKVDGAQDIFIEPVLGMSQIVVDYDRSLLAQYGLQISDINRILHTAFAGQIAGQIFENERRFNIVVRLENENRTNIQDIQNLLIPTPSGIQVPLYQIAKVEIRNTINQIQREDAKRRIIVGFNVRGKDVQSVVQDLQDVIAQKVTLPAGYFINYGGTFENLNQAKKRLMIAVPVALFLIFIMLYFAFRHLKHGLIIFTAIPLSAIGGILFLALRGMPFSISAGVGFIALFGVSVLNGIVLITEYNRLKKEGLTDLFQIVYTGTKLRLRPVLMTAFVASLGFLPMAISNGAGAEVQRPLATVVIGGLLIATLLTLFVLPILYVFSESKSDFKFSINKAIPILLISLLLAPSKILAQHRISLNHAIEIALKNNGALKNEVLKSQLKKTLVKTSKDIPNTNIGINSGQLNSALFDHQLFLNQSISLPIIYRNTRNLKIAEYQASLSDVKRKEADLKKDIMMIYYHIQCLYAKKQLLKKLDSTYKEFERKAYLRLKKGESNILEKTTADIQLAQIHIQKSELEGDIFTSESLFRFYLNAEEKYYPIHESPMMTGRPSDTTKIIDHPSLLSKRDHIQIMKAVTHNEKSKRLPDLNFGILSGTIRGAGADNIYYTASSRFHTAQFGLSVPILNSAVKNKIKASQINEQIAESEYQLTRLKLKNDIEAYERNHKVLSQNLSYLRSEILPKTDIIIHTANLQFTGGQINYLDWVQLIHQAINIENTHIDAMQAYNENLISLLYFLNQI